MGRRADGYFCHFCKAPATFEIAGYGEKWFACSGDACGNKSDARMKEIEKKSKQGC